MKKAQYLPGEVYSQQELDWMLKRGQITPQQYEQEARKIRKQWGKVVAY